MRNNQIRGRLNGAGIAAAIVGGVVSITSANATSFHGSDRVNVPSYAGATKSLAAEAAWIAAASGAGPVHLQDFESFSGMSSSTLSLTIAPGVTMRVTQPGLPPFSGIQVTNRVPNVTGYVTNGFNTTPGGNMHAELDCVTQPFQKVTLFFHKPVQAFSCAITGTGSGGFLFDRVSHQMDWNGPGNTGFFYNVHGEPDTAYWDNALFAGFVDGAARATEVVVWLRFPSQAASPASYSMDDIRWVEAADVPAPGVLGVGVLVGFAGLRRRWR